MKLQPLLWCTNNNKNDVVFVCHTWNYSWKMPCQFRMSHTEHDTSLSLLDSQITANSCMLWLLSAVCWVCAVRVNPRVYMIILHFFTILLFIHCVLVSFIALFCAHGPKGELRAPRAIYTATHLWFSKQTNTLSTNQRNTGNKAFVALLLLIQINSCCLHCCIHKNRPLWWWALAAEAICALCCVFSFSHLNSIDNSHSCGGSSDSLVPIGNWLAGWGHAHSTLLQKSPKNRMCILPRPSLSIHYYCSFSLALLWFSCGLLYVSSSCSPCNGV